MADIMFDPDMTESDSSSSTDVDPVMSSSSSSTNSSSDSDTRSEAKRRPTKRQKRHRRRGSLDFKTNQWGNQLIRRGYVVLPFLRPSQLEPLRRQLLETTVHSPEFKKHVPATYTYRTTSRNKAGRPPKEHTVPMQYQGGGFSALGHPSSFHNPVVRKLRQWAMHAVVPVMRGVLRVEFSHEPRALRAYKLEQVIDRLMIRPKKYSPTRESWHRDETPTASKDDIVFGGWINLNDEPQYFSGIVGTHRRRVGTHSKKSGFYAIPKSDHAKFQARKATQGGPICIPPGHLFIFVENMVHEVLPSKRVPADQYRLFTAWRLTQENTPLHGEDDLKSTLRNQGVARLKSDQRPPMFAGLWQSNHWRRLSAWSQALFHPSLLRRHTIGSGAHRGTQYMSIPRFLPSLADLGLERYSPYSKDEANLYRPSVEWKVLPLGKSRGPLTRLRLF